MQTIINENQQLNNIISRLAWLQVRRLAKTLAPENITVPQYQTLLAIKQADNNPALPCTMGYLARQTKLTQPTITDITKRLTQKKLITTHQQPNDMRIVLASLTTSGIDCLNRITATNQQIVATDIKHLNIKDKEYLHTYLNLYLSILKKGA